MLIWLVDNFFIFYSYKFKIMHCFSFRVIFSLLSSFFIALGIGYRMIKWLHKLHFLQIIRLNGPKLHMLKCGTPTMGGTIVLISVIISMIMWVDWSNRCLWYILFILISHGILGLMDDLYKIKRENVTGVSAFYKYLWQSLITVALIIVLIFDDNIVFDQLVIPGISNVVLQFSFFWYIMLSYFTLVGTSNAVNLSDGLDGLVVIPIVLIAAGLGIVAWIVSNAYYANYFHLPYLYYARELVVICFAIIGSGLGFLWFNVYPAQVFMGDVGSLSLGGALGAISVLLRQELLLLIIGGVFVIETCSVILQIGYFKIYKKRIFKMAPIHHHFELYGCPENRVIVRFWIVSLLLLLLGLATLKIR